MTSKKIVTVVQHNHFDPIWRRCWDRTFDYLGKRYRSYAELEEYIINIWLDSVKRGATFSEGQSAVIRKYLERNPERLAELRDLVKKGMLELTAAGETVADTNMPSGETLLRNFVMGQRYFEDTFGVIPKIGWLEDAFGQSAQIPQILRGVECNLVMCLCYKRVPGVFWKGLDGSVIHTGDTSFTYYSVIGTKIGPCPECSGMGCKTCNMSGLSEAGRLSDEKVKEALDFKDYTDHPFPRINVGGEETIPNPRLSELVVQANAERDDVEFRFGGFGHIVEHFADGIAQIDDPNLKIESDQMEGNPASTGCYVTRIKIKQHFRRVENFVNMAERWAAVAHLMGYEYPVECLTRAWRDLIFVAFHDAITCTHVDAAYVELMDMMENAECEAMHVLDDALDHIESKTAPTNGKDYLMVYNSESWERDDPVTIAISGIGGKPMLKDAAGKEIEVLDVTAEGLDMDITFCPPKVPAMGYAAVEFVPDSEPVDSGTITSGPGEIENEFFKIRVSERGIESMIDKRIDEEILDASKYLANELILEEDVGHPWGTMQPPSFEEGLSRYTTGVKIRKAANASEITVTGTYKGSDENVKLLSWRQSIKLYKGYDRIDFHTHIDWDTAQRRIRVVFPTNIKTSDGIYSIPYGAIKRWKYQPEMDFNWSTNGDWPAINWVDLYGEGENRGYALINTGMPSHKIEDGVIYMSLLRSPTDSWCVNEPEYYDCPDFDGARDAGVHDFRYSLIPHPGDYRSASIEKRAREVNTPLVIRSLESDGKGKLGLVHSFMKLDALDNVIVTALKKADRDDGVVVRLAETAGKPAEVSVSIEGAGTKVSTVNFLERGPKPVTGKVKVGPFKIVTLTMNR